MKVFFNYVFFSFLVLSCSKNDKVEIVMFSKEVNCVFNEMNDSLDSCEYQPSSINIINYKIKNNTDEKYFFCIDDLFFTTSEHSDNRSDSFYKNYGFNVRFNMIENDSICFGKMMHKNLNHSQDCKNYFLDEKRRIYIIEGYDFENNKRKKIVSYDETVANLQNKLLKYGFILYPGQERSFTTCVNLPLRSEIDNFNWYTKIEKGKSYFSFLLFSQDKSKIEKYLTKDLKNDLLINDVKIFNGKIESNKIPVKIISIY